MSATPHLSPYVSHTYDADRLPTDKARSWKVWELPKLEDLKKHRTKRTFPEKKASEPTIPALEELMKLLKHDTKPRSLQQRSHPQHLKRGLVQAYRRPTVKSEGRSALQIAGKEGLTLRPKLVSKSLVRRSAALLPLRVSNAIGLSDPCFRVMNYSGLELKHCNEEVKSVAMLKPATTPSLPPLTMDAEEKLPVQLQFQPIPANSVSGERMRSRAPKSPPLFRRPLPISRSAKLEGWEISPVNISPLGNH